MQGDTHAASDHLPVVMDFSVPPPVTQDSDLDGLDDSEEAQLGTDPFDADTDDDGLTDGFEALVSGTDPLLQDTNVNGCPDGEEAFQLCASCPSDLNNDGVVSVADGLLVTAVCAGFGFTYGSRSGWLPSTRRIVRRQNVLPDVA